MAAIRTRRFTLTNRDFMGSKNPAIVKWRNKQEKNGFSPFCFSYDYKKKGWMSLIADTSRNVTINNQPLTEAEKKEISEIKDEKTAEEFFKKKFKAKAIVPHLISHYSQTPMLWASAPLGTYNYSSTNPMNGKYSINQSYHYKTDIYEKKGDIFIQTSLPQVPVISLENGKPLYNILGPIEVIFKLNTLHNPKPGYALERISTNSKILKKIYMGEIQEEAQLEKALNKKLIKSTAFIKKLPQKMKIIKDKKSALANKLSALWLSKEEVKEETLNNLGQKIALLNACLNIYMKYSTDESNCSFSEFKTEINKLNVKMGLIPKTGALELKGSRQLIKELATEINELKVVPFFSTVESEFKDEKKAELNPTNDADKVSAKQLTHHNLLARTSTYKIPAETNQPHAALGAGSPNKAGT